MLYWSDIYLLTPQIRQNWLLAYVHRLRLSHNDSFLLQVHLESSVHCSESLHQCGFPCQFGFFLIFNSLFCAEMCLKTADTDNYSSAASLSMHVFLTLKFASWFSPCFVCFVFFFPNTRLHFSLHVFKCCMLQYPIAGSFHNSSTFILSCSYALTIR